MEIKAPTYLPADPRRARDARSVFANAARVLILQAVQADWREAEAAMALADAADEYVMFLAERPKRLPAAANSN